MTKRPVLIGIAAVVVVALVGVAAAYAYFFSGLRTAPKPLALNSATPSPRASASSAPASPAGLTGAWKVVQGSQAGYRVSERFAGQQSTHQAVARTSTVSGGLTVADAGGALRAMALQFTAGLSDLRSVDQVAGFDVANRDRIVSRSLSVTQYPQATFEADAVDLPATLTTGSTVTLTIPGQLTIHGVTRPAQLAAQVRMNGAQVEAAGSTTFAMTDFGVDPPQVPITTVDSSVTMEFQVVLGRS